MRMKGQARSIDVNMLLYETEKMISKTIDFMEYVEEQFCDIWESGRLEGAGKLRDGRHSLRPMPRQSSVLLPLRRSSIKGRNSTAGVAFMTGNWRGSLIETD